MKYIAAYLLANLAGKASPSADDISQILKSVGISPEQDKVNNLVNDMKSKTVQQVIDSGKKKLATIPVGGGGGAGTAAVVEKKEDKKKDEKKKEEPKKEEKKKEEPKKPVEEEDDGLAGGFDLFGGAE